MLRRWLPMDALLQDSPVRPGIPWDRHAKFFPAWNGVLPKVLRIGASIVTSGLWGSIFRKKQWNNVPTTHGRTHGRSHGRSHKVPSSPVGWTIPSMPPWGVERLSEICSVSCYVCSGHSGHGERPVHDSCPSKPACKKFGHQELWNCHDHNISQPMANSAIWIAVKRLGIRRCQTVNYTCGHSQIGIRRRESH